MFGGSAWDRVTRPDGTPGEWYLHLFDPRQPDLNWDNPEVREEFLDILRFWFDRGADGFRIDVAHGLVKQDGLPELGHDEEHVLAPPDRSDHPHWDRPEVHDIYREWRRLADSYDPPRVFVAEAWVGEPDRLAAYLRPDELHTAFDFDFVRAPWNAEELRGTASGSLRVHDSVGAPVTWVMSNHDIMRHVTRLGRPQPKGAVQELGSGNWSQPVDLVLGRRRARAVLLLELALPGGACLYQGEELGLEEVEDLPEELLQDPTWIRSGYTERGRDGCRVPLPWTTSGAVARFRPGHALAAATGGWAQLSVEAQERDPASMLSLYRRALRLRRELPALGAGTGDDVHWLDLGRDVVGFSRRPGFACVANVGTGTLPLPSGRSCSPAIRSSPAESSRPTPPYGCAVTITRSRGPFDQGEACPPGSSRAAPAAWVATWPTPSSTPATTRSRRRATLPPSETSPRPTGTEPLRWRSTSPTPPRSWRRSGRARSGSAGSTSW